MPISRVRPPLSVYYGPATPQAVETLAVFGTVIIQTTLYQAADLQRLRAAGTRVLGYLSLTEDHPLGAWAARPGSAPYHLRPNPAWDSVVVDAAHPAWREVLLGRAADALRGADGLLLDTLGTDSAATLALVRALRRQFPQATLLVNRGFGLLPELARWSDGVLFEAFSTTHTPSYAPHDSQGLAYTAHWLGVLRELGVPVLLLDYADQPALAAFARTRAAEFGLTSFVTNRKLSLPGGLP